MDEQGNILRFPPQFRVVELTGDAPRLAAPDSALVNHGGRTYLLVELLAFLSWAELVEVEATMPRTSQAVWDELVRR